MHARTHAQTLTAVVCSFGSLFYSSLFTSSYWFMIDYIIIQTFIIPWSRVWGHMFGVGGAPVDRMLYHILPIRTTLLRTLILFTLF